MLLFVGILANLALLCTISRAGDIKTHSKKYVVGRSNYNMMPSSIAFTDNSFSYANCEDNFSDDTYECLVRLEISKVTHKECRVKFNSFHFFKVQIMDRVDNKVIFQTATWNYTKNRKPNPRTISVINMDNCSAIHMEFPFDKIDDLFPITDFKSYLHVYHDSFDVLVRNNSVLCGKYATCVLRHDYNGQRVGKPINISSRYSVVNSMPVNKFHPEKGAYFIVAEVDESKVPLSTVIIRVIHVNGMSVQTNFFSIPINDIKDGIEPILFANEYEYFSMCYLMNPENLKARCLQYNFLGHQMMNVTLDMNRREIIVGIFGLYEGGIGLVYHGCYNAPGCTNFHVKTVHPYGRVMKHVEISDGVQYQCFSPSTYNELVVNHMETSDEHCFYFACKHNEEHSMVSFKYTSKCLNTRTYF